MHTSGVCIVYTVNPVSNTRKTMNQLAIDFTSAIKAELLANNGKLSYPFIQSVANSAASVYLKPTPNMRLCILTLSTGHEVLGKAQVLDAANDVEELGNKVAYDNAVNELWAVCGTIAKLYL